VRLFAGPEPQQTYGSSSQRSGAAAKANALQIACLSRALSLSLSLSFRSLTAAILNSATTLKVTDGNLPYAGLSNDSVILLVVGGGRMQKPAECSQRLFEMLLMCWEAVPSKRSVIELLLTSAVPFVRGVRVRFRVC
jgi:hypothetical protein